MTEASLIFNPNAGRIRRNRLTEVHLIRMLSDNGITVVRTHADDIPGVEQFVESLEPDTLLIMAGGDGTMYEVVQVPACRQLGIGIIPLGTANNLARSVGIPPEVEAAVHVIAGGKERLVDMGIANEHVFTQAAGVGFHAEAFRLYGERRTRDLARAGLVILNLMAEWTPGRMLINVDGATHESDAVQVTVSNSPIYGQAYPIAPDAMIDDGLLDVVEITDCRPGLELAGCVVDFMEGRELDPSKVSRIRGRRIEITPLNESAIPAHADAEPIGYAPVTIEVLPSCLRLIVPA